MLYPSVSNGIKQIKAEETLKTLLPAGWPPRWADLATPPPHLTEENRSHFCRQWEISRRLTTAGVTFVSSVACPVQGRVSSLIQPVHTNLVLDAFPQPAQITCSPEKWKGQTSTDSKNWDGCWPQSEKMHNNRSVHRCRTSFGCFVHWIVNRLCLLGNYNEAKKNWYFH